MDTHSLSSKIIGMQKMLALIWTIVLLKERDSLWSKQERREGANLDRQLEVPKQMMFASIATSQAIGLMNVAKSVIEKPVIVEKEGALSAVEGDINKEIAEEGRLQDQAAAAEAEVEARTEGEEDTDHHLALDHPQDLERLQEKTETMKKREALKGANLLTKSEEASATKGKAALLSERKKVLPAGV